MKKQSQYSRAEYDQLEGQMRFFLIHIPRLKEIAYQRKIKNRIRWIAKHVSFASSILSTDRALERHYMLRWGGEISVEFSILKEHVK